MADDTLGGLARKTGVDGIALEKAVKHYNRGCERGEDADFHRRMGLSIWINLPRGGNLGECLAFGRIAGREAAREKAG